MNKFNGLEMLYIDIANCYGLDKEDWTTRLLFVEEHEQELETLTQTASEPLLYTKAVKALRRTQNGEKSGHIMFLDATASGLQIMACLSGCHDTAAQVNLINTGQREDVYCRTAVAMNQKLYADDLVTRKVIKKPLMTHYYNKQNQVTLNDNQQVAFYQVLEDNFTGAEEVKNIINRYWNKNASEHVWTLPDGHVARVPVTQMKDARIEVNELDHTRFTYRFEIVKPSDRGTSLVPNVIHSIDAYIAREMVRRAHQQKFQMAHIHDAFCTHPNHMQKVRENYRDILAEIADMPLLQTILRELSGSGSLTLTKNSNDLSKEILQSEYALS